LITLRTSELIRKNLEADTDASSPRPETGIDHLAFERSERIAQPNRHAVGVACGKLFAPQKDFFD